MHRYHYSFVVAGIIWLLAATSASSESLSYNEIRDVLRANPPGIGNQAARENALTQLDQYLVRHTPILGPDPGAEPFYRDMLSSLADEMSLPVLHGARIWQMYNDGFIVKTPHGTFAFDLLRRPRQLDPVYPATWSYQFPDAVLDQIDFVMISHEHADHNDRRLQEILQLKGKPLLRWDNFPLNTTTMMGDLKVVAYEGHHDVTNHIFTVTTPAGLSIMHTGDNDAASSLPDNVRPDILLVSAETDVRAAIERVSPVLTIPGHIHELVHAPEERVRYASALAIDDVSLTSQVVVMAWGEHYDYRTSAVPEPSTCVPLLLGWLIAPLLRRRRGL